MIDELRQNIDTEIDILREISNYLHRQAYASPSEKKLLETAINSLKSSARMINNSIPKLLVDVAIAQKLPRKEALNPQLEKVEFKRLDSRIHVTLNVEDRGKFFKELSISEDLVRKIRKSQNITKDNSDEIKSARLYLKISNKFFLQKANSLINKGHFKSLSLNLRKANIEILLSSYVAFIIFSIIVSFFFAVFLVLFFMLFQFETVPPYLALYSGGNYLLRFLELLLLPIIIPMATFLVLYNYPSMEKDSLAKQIEQELPFAVIQMGAVSGSGIEPSEIFKIIGISREYPFLRKEIRKVLNQINLYGYDLVTALKNVSKSTPSPRLAELFSGMAVTITSGGDLPTFFEKRAESLLMTYRLDREKYTKTAETFMDIYISIVIAAPMILMVLMVMIQVSNMGSAFSVSTIILIVAVINVIFLSFLTIKQPTY